jgi:hypothetical protein
MGNPTTSAEREKKKVEIGAVIDFCNANGIPNLSKRAIFKFFKVPDSTGFNWFPGSSSPNHRRATQLADADPSSISQASRQQSPPIKRKNPVRNGGRDRKRLKSIIEDLAGEDSDEDIDEDSDASSPPPLDSRDNSKSSSSPKPESPLTPPKRKIAQPRKTAGLHPGFQFEYGEVTVIKEEGMDDEIVV